jgi:lipoyl(octanoyl) transferase
MKLINADYTYLDMMPYSEAWQLQKQLFDQRRLGAIPDTLLFLQHPHTFTIGKTGELSHLLLNNTALQNEDIHFEMVDRGGDITYHGPNQLVVYPILDLNQHEKDLHHYLRQLEEVVIFALRKLGLTATRKEGLTGVWLQDEKVCAIGVKVSRWITMHGLALNINPDLSYFSKIIPCGIRDKKVTSLQKHIDQDISVDSVLKLLCEGFEHVFHFKLTKIDAFAYDYT